MSVVDIIQAIGVIATIVFSLIAFIQSLLSKNDSKKANELAEKANNISQDANMKAEKANVIAEESLNEIEKSYMPIVRFTKEVHVEKKDIFTLRNEITFDFYNVTFDIFNNFQGVFESPESDENEITCISAEIENCGNGVITGIEIKNFFIQSGNKVSIDRSSQEELEALCYIDEKECNCTQEFILAPKEKVTVNFMITNNVADRENSDYGYAEECIKEFMEGYRNIMISMSLKISSINQSEYEQRYLWGTFVDNKIVHNTFSECECVKKFFTPPKNK